MITSPQNRPWPGDCMIEAYEQAGLPIPSVVRPAKITTIETRDAGFVGRLPAEVTDQVLRTVAGWIGR
jgi:mRNA interferase MazF